MAYQFMKANKGRYTITEMSGLLGVSRSGYYKWARTGVSNRQKEADDELVHLIREIVAKHHKRYGSPRVRQELRSMYGKHVSLKKVARLMRENNLNARLSRKFIQTTDSKHTFPVSENILNREFHAEKGGQKWVSDITYVRTMFGWIYLTVVLDLYDRKIIGWALSADMETSHTTIAALEMAVKNRNPEHGLIFHSDRGVQYCAQSFRDILREKCSGVRQSMSRKGNCWDNACAESFFKTLKREEETLDGRHSAAEVRQSVFMYIEAYYNRIRRTFARCSRYLTMLRLMNIIQVKSLNSVYLLG
jgi:transposase InsO family protein